MRIERLSIIIPCYNEAQTIEEVIARVFAVDFGREREIIIVDDCSTDGTREFLEQLSEKKIPDIHMLFHAVNQGKGAAIQSALSAVTGEYMIVQDADLEYSPRDIVKLIEKAEQTNALVVYGSRNLTKDPQYLYPMFYWGVRALTFFLNVLYRQRITDPETCYKLIRTDLFRAFRLRENGFGIEIEITTKIAQRNITISEVPISYHPRSFREGKKITVKDGIIAFYLVFLPCIRSRTNRNIVLAAVAVVCNLALVIAHFALKDTLGFFDLDVEQNAASIWTGIQLWIAGTLALISVFIMSAAGYAWRDRVILLLAGLSFIYVGLDDMTMFHERLGFVLNNALGLGGFYGESFNWLLYYSPGIAVALGVYAAVFLFFRRDSRAASVWFFGGILFWIAALMIEYIGGRMIIQQSANISLYQTLVAGEEFFEMFGTTFMGGAFLALVQLLFRQHIRIITNEHTL